VGKVVESLRKGTLSEGSLFIATLEVVGILNSEPIFFSLLSSEENITTASGETFLKVEKAETLLKEYLLETIHTYQDYLSGNISNIVSPDPLYRSLVIFLG